MDLIKNDGKDVTSFSKPKSLVYLVNGVAFYSDLDKEQLIGNLMTFSFNPIRWLLLSLSPYRMISSKHFINKNHVVMIEEITND